MQSTVILRVSQGDPSVIRDLERSTPLLSGVIFLSEDGVEVEYISESPVTSSSSLPPNFLSIILHIGNLTHRPTIAVVSPSFLLMTTTRNTISTMSTSSVHTPLSIEGGGTISISDITPSTTISFSTSILSSSGGT